MSVTLRQIQSFLHVARLGSFTRAAERLRVAQPALSQQIRELEAELGIKLFDRTTRRVELTEGGHEFHASAARIVAELEGAVRQAHGLAERTRGRISLAAPPLLAAVVAPRAIADFHQEHPGIQVSVVDARTDQIVEQVRAGQVDCGLGTFRAEEEGVRATRLARDRLMLFCPRGDALAGRREVDWRELAGRRLIALTRDSGIRLLTEMGFEAARTALSPAYEVSYVTTALAMVEAGLGVAVLPTYAWAAARAERVEAAPLTNPAMIRDIVMITPSGRAGSPALAGFRRYLAKHTLLALPQE